jgi:myo-inositol-1-phosphate synthase
LALILVLSKDDEETVMRKIKVAVAGVGNCCSALMQSTLYYRNNKSGLLHNEIGGMLPSDIEIVDAFDIDSRKVGKDLSEAIFAQPNVAPKVLDVPQSGIKVKKGEVLDGASGVLKELIAVDPTPAADIVKHLKSVEAEMLINLLPTGCQKASEFYANAALEAGCAFVNCTPAKISNDPAWAKSFESRGLPIVGDDLLSQLGGTALHMGLLDLFNKRGILVDKTYQLDIGGSMEAYGVLEDFRREEKRKVKADAIKQVLPPESQVATGTSDFVSFMKDRRTSYFFLHGIGCLGSEVVVDIFFRTQDSSNGAGMLLDVIRGVKLALDRKIGGDVPSISAYGFKSTSNPTSVTEAQNVFNEFIQGKRSR